jgi:hypothetical protein
LSPDPGSFAEGTERQAVDAIIAPADKEKNVRLVGSGMA